MGVFGLKTKVLNIKKNYNSYKCYIVKNTWSYSLSEHPYCTQLTVAIPGGFPEASVDRGNTYVLLFWQRLKRSWNKQELLQLSYTVSCTHAFYNCPYCKIDSIPQPDSPCHFKHPVLARSRPPSAWSSWGVCRSWNKTLEKRCFPKGSKRKVKMCEEIRYKSNSSPVQGW